VLLYAAKKPYCRRLTSGCLFRFYAWHMLEWKSFLNRSHDVGVKGSVTKSLSQAGNEALPWTNSRFNLSAVAATWAPDRLSGFRSINETSFIARSAANCIPFRLVNETEHSETMTKTETRECETEIETETETKNLLWDRDQKLRDRDKDQSSQVNCRWK